MYRFKKFTQTQSSSNLNELGTLVGEKHSPVSSSFSWRVLRSSAEERTNTYSIGCISKAIPHLLLQLLLKSYEKIYNSSRCTSPLTIRPLFFFFPKSRFSYLAWTLNHFVKLNTFALSTLKQMKIKMENKGSSLATYKSHPACFLI